MAEQIIVLDEPRMRQLVQSVVQEVIRRQDEFSGNRLAYKEAEAAALLGLHVNQLAEARRMGELRYTRIGKTGVRYTRKQLEAYLKKREA